MFAITRQMCFMGLRAFGDVGPPTRRPGFCSFPLARSGAVGCLPLAVGGGGGVEATSRRRKVGPGRLSVGGDSGPATFNRPSAAAPDTDGAAMNDEPKHDYDALLADLRERAEEAFPGWTDFLADRTERAPLHEVIIGVASCQRGLNDA